MRITRRITWDIETWAVLEHEYEDYSGPISWACSGGDQTAGALEKSQAAQTSVLNADYATAFAQQSKAYGHLQALMNYTIANPMGYTPQQLATARTSINENTATAAKHAMGAAAAFAASHGGADVGNGAVGELAGEISSGAAQSKAQQLSELSQQNEQLKQQNFWRGIEGLGGVGQGYGSQAGTAASGGTGAAESSVSAGKLFQESKQAGWQNIAGVMSGAGSLLKGIGSLGKGGGGGGGG